MSDDIPPRKEDVHEDQTIIALRGRGSSGMSKLIALTQEEILAEVKRLSLLNQKIFDECKAIADREAERFTSSEDPQFINTKLQIALAFFSALSISSYTAVRSRLEQFLNEK